MIANTFFSSFQQLQKPPHLKAKFKMKRTFSNTDKQFRTWANKPDELADFVSSKYWIDKLPTS